jgi:hypothetical protein
MSSPLIRIAAGILPALAFACAFGVLAATEAEARERPRGDWSRYCKDVDVRGDWLEADCRKHGGGWRKNTRINFDNCPGNEVTVRDGHLVCERRYGWNGHDNGNHYGWNNGRGNPHYGWDRDNDRRDWDRRDWDRRGHDWDRDRNDRDRHDWNGRRDNDRRDGNWNGRRDDDRNRQIVRRDQQHQQQQQERTRQNENRRDTDRRDDNQRRRDAEEWWKRGAS